MFKKFQDMFSIPELRKRILFTVALLVVYRVGSHITAPGVNPLALKVFFENQQGTIFALYDLFAGGNLSRATIFALGIMPYISASIIMQLLQTVIPYFEKLAKEGEEGRKKITQYTRYGTVLLSVVQAMGISIFLLSMKPGGVSVVTMSPATFRLLTVITMTAGTIFIMWLGEQISERGIGNGISLIIMIGILARYPGYFLNTWRAIKLGQITAFRLVFLLLIMVGVVAAVILITQGQRRIPVQYAKRIVGNKIYGGTSQYIPLRVNTAGVIPIIFARSIMMFPSTIAMFFKGSGTLDYIRTIFAPGTWLYLSIYGVIIIFFTYFYTAIILNPTDMAENMKKYGGFIPGIRPGKRTSDYIDRILTRVTLPGAIFLAFIAILPDVLMRRGGLPFYFGGTGVLIIVGVLLDTLKQIETHLLMRHYDGFMKKGKLRGRR
ncbi:MAG: preprotein translocase subunit SecY [Candidatus Krumholzibacteriales bacterium]